MLTIYGIKNCDTMKKAFKELDGLGLEYDFYDYKKNSPTKELIKGWREFLGEWPVNKRGTTFRKIKEEFESASDSKKTKLLIDNPSAIKRPIVESDGSVYCIGLDAKKLYSS